MSKKILRRSLALGAMMAFVITGSAWAGVYTEAISIAVGNAATYEDGIELVDKGFNNAGEVTAKEIIFSTYDTHSNFINTGTINTGVLDIYNGKAARPTFGGTIIATDKFIWRGQFKDVYLDAVVNTSLLHIIANQNDTEHRPDNQAVGLIVRNGGVLDGVENIIVDSNGAQAALVIHGDANIDYNRNITLESQNDNSNALIELYHNSSLAVKNLIVKGPEGKIQYSFADSGLQELGTVSVDSLNITDSSSLDLCYWAGSDVSSLSSTFTFDEINIGDNGSMYAVVNAQNQPNLEIKGNINMNLGTGAVVDFGAYKKNHVDWLGNKMFVNASSLTINTADGSAEVYLSDAATDGLKNEDIKVISSVPIEETVDVVWRTHENEKTAATNLPEKYAAKGVQLVQRTNDVEDVATGEVGVDQNGNPIPINISTSQNPDTYGVTENNALNLITWRAEMNDMNKRMGELRNANGEHGVWVRMVRGEDEYESINHQYNQYQLGYDEKLSVDPSWTVGVALSYTEGDSTYSTGSAENKHKGLSIYGSKLNEDGTFIDLIAKYARLENDFKNTWGTGDYSTNGYSVSAEFGKRIKQGGGVWIEPQVELTYGKVSAADYNINKINVAQDGIESLVGRVGFSLGKDIKQGNVYARASYLYDFDGETKSTFVDTASGSGTPRIMKDDLGGGWWEVGVGANINLSKATYIYADIEKTFGGEVDTNWQWNLGVRYSF